MRMRRGERQSRRRILAAAASAWSGYLLLVRRLEQQLRASFVGPADGAVRFAKLVRSFNEKLTP